MRIKDHRKFAKDLARMLRMDEGMAEVGSVLPDFDLIKPLKHRRSLHNLKLLSILMAGSSYSPKLSSLALGYASHIILDFLGLKNTKTINKILRKS